MPSISYQAVSPLQVSVAGSCPSDWRAASDVVRQLVGDDPRLRREVRRVAGVVEVVVGVDERVDRLVREDALQRRCRRRRAHRRAEGVERDDTRVALDEDRAVDPLADRPDVPAQRLVRHVAPLELARNLARDREDAAMALRDRRLNWFFDGDDSALLRVRL